MEKELPMEAYFLGPKAEQGKTLSEIINYILQDYLHWRRNYFPEDQQILDRAQRRRHEPWFDILSNNLDVILSRLKADFPFYSPRYMAHMLSENVMPGIVGYFAGMLYNPNNVTPEAAPITVKLELEVGKMIASMIGYDANRSWSHITSGGTVANLEALWAARQNQLNGLAFGHVAKKYGIDVQIPMANGQPANIVGLSREELIGLKPDVLVRLPEMIGNAIKSQEIDCSVHQLMSEAKYGDFSITKHGLNYVYDSLGIEPKILVSEAAHYSIRKIINLLGLGEKNVICVPTTNQFRMDIRAVKKILTDLKGDQVITALIGITGTTETGAVDPLHEILEVKREYESERNRSFWLHVDAAWGGYMKTMDTDNTQVLSDEVKRSIGAIHHADSVTIDPHKLGYIPYPAGIISFKDKFSALHSHQTAPYITLDSEIPNPLDISDLDNSMGPYIVEGSKPGASAAATWLTHRSIPLSPEGHGMIISQTIENARLFYDEIMEINRENIQDEGHPLILEPVNTPDTNVVCFFFKIKGTSRLDQHNHLNSEIYKSYTLQDGAPFAHMPYTQNYFISHTQFFPSQYPYSSVESILAKIQTTVEDYDRNGLFVLRSVIMNPWIRPAREKGFDYLQDALNNIQSTALKVYAKMELDIDAVMK